MLYESGTSSVQARMCSTSQAHDQYFQDMANNERKRGDYLNLAVAVFSLIVYLGNRPVADLGSGLRAESYAGFLLKNLGGVGGGEQQVILLNSRILFLLFLLLFFRIKGGKQGYIFLGQTCFRSAPLPRSRKSAGGILADDELIHDELKERINKKLSAPVSE